ncbi:c-type cytochrome biogenesis protein CcmI [Sedimentitalea nanhaiensis]|uniref:Cytochrome c-type biogenesis protein CcmH n=1 Tax=Sedimentitalea nanhaiensis TaxID=999627 RepID=A0A1I7DYB8_9RHOB|nr:c-type cytochrome biogenesis protein CcmI [Sedimentitalea nanhaiensis]SFU16661.1 cytochrome c-type biogenesis protein CcmH [Sedimentitalea nanhaiensis]
MIFWIITSALGFVIALTLGLVLLRSRPQAEPAAAYDLRVYRDQLKDVDRDLERGVIGEADATRIRTEVSRRILTADSQLQAGRARSGQSHRITVVMAILIGAITVGGSLWLYRTLGAPGYGDLGLSQRIEIATELRANRPDQAVAEANLPPAKPPAELGAEYLTLLERLRETVATRPDDAQGQALLARHEAATGNFAAAHAAQAQVLRLRGDAATAEDYGNYVDMLVLAAGGYVSPTAEAALREVLARDPENGPGRYYWGLMMGQTGRPDLAFRIWNSLLRDSPADAPWTPPLRAQIVEMAMRAGVDFELPAAQTAPGPSAADVAAAGEMDEADRTQMIRGMVQGLSDRLATEGGAPPEWARLINALGVLGDTDRARAIHRNAQQVFAGNDAALGVIDAAARQAGVLQ